MPLGVINVILVQFLILALVDVTVLSNTKLFGTATAPLFKLTSRIFNGVLSSLMSSEGSNSIVVAFSTFSL